ncbi:hypothetical protein STEG23_004155, partial [Scotinomys teguina]
MIKAIEKTFWKGIPYADVGKGCYSAPPPQHLRGCETTIHIRKQALDIRLPF